VIAPIDQPALIGSLKQVSAGRGRRCDRLERRQLVVLNVVQERALILQLRFLRRILHDVQLGRERIDAVHNKSSFALSFVFSSK
jgi:hypothetical protein